MTRTSRRAVLRLGAGASLGALVGLGGCTLSDPTVREPSRSPTPSRSGSPSAPPPTPPTSSGAARAAVSEMELVAYAVAVRGRSGVTKANRAWLSDLADAHRARAAALVADPPSPPKVSGSAISRAALAQRERATARRYRRTALTSSGADALLWASMSIASAGFAGAAVDTTPPDLARLRPPKPVAVLTDTAATQQLVAQLHAVVYGYQLAMGRLSRFGGTYDRARSELRHHRKTRDELIALLKRRKAEVPAAEPAYVPSVEPTSAARAERLIRSLLVALQPFAGLLVAASGDDDRERAIEILDDLVDRAGRWGAPLPIWPGYVR